MKNLLVAQSGGPTSAINATLAGVIKKAAEGKADRILGARNGIEGLLKESFIDLTDRAKEEGFLTGLALTPSSALGSCRYKIKPDEFGKIIEIFRKHEIAYFVYIGGNDSMDTVYQLSNHIREQGIEDIKVIGAPKTIDNDLFGIDHCPGFGSAAKYIAAIFSELERELAVYDVENILIVELMGRNAGWLTASAALAQRKSKIPYLIYLEEVPFCFEKFMEDIKEKRKESKQIMIAVSEGIHLEDGRYISDIGKDDIVLDAFGHAQPGGVGKILENLVKKEIGCKTRAIEVSLLQRCAGHLLSAVDLDESVKLGCHAADMALKGESGRMASLRRVSEEPYAVEYVSTDIKEVANREKKVPREWINTAQNGVTEEMIAYLTPLIQGEMSSKFENGLLSYVIL